MITQLDVVVEASDLYQEIAAELRWSLDPTAPQPTHFRIELTTGSTTETTEVAAPATSHIFWNLRSEAVYEATLWACFGGGGSETCDTDSASFTTPNLDPPHIGIDAVIANVTSPTTVEVTAIYSQSTTINPAYTAVAFTTVDGGDTVYLDQNLTGDDFVWTGATPGTTYTVSYSACGGPTPTSMVCGGASTTVTTPEMQPAITGTVLSDTGVLEGAIVMAVAETDVWWPTAVSATGSDGSFTIDQLPPGTYKVHVVAPSGSHLGSYWHGGNRSRTAATPVTVDATAVEVHVVYPERTMISGSVIVGGVPVPGARVLAYQATDRWVGTADTTTAADGTYSLAGLDPGTYRLLVKPPAGTGVSTWHGGLTRGTATAHQVDGSTFVVDAAVDLAPT